MDSVKPPPVTSNVSGLVRSFAKALRFKAEGAAAAHKDRRNRKTKFQEKPTNGSAVGVNGSQSFHDDDDVVDEDEKLRIKASTEALLSKLFASISSVKAAYAQLQTSQSPYDPEGIQSADEMIINELKCLSEFKQRFVKKTIDPSPGFTQLQAEIQEQQSLLKTYEIMGRKFESQLKLQDSEITFLREKLEDCDEQNRSLEKRFNPSGSLSILQEDLHFTGLNPNHFITVLRYTIKSIRSFTRFMIDEMESSRWDIDAAAGSIEPGSVYQRPNQRSYAFESFVCRVMFDGFQYQNFGISNHSMKDKEQQRLHFFKKFNELKSKTSEELMARKLNSTSGRFFRAKYFQLVHPKMELSFFGDLTQRNLINSGKHPDTKFCYTFGEMVKRVWLLHCLAFSFDPEASIFQIRKGCRFSEVYMENVVENPFQDPPIIDPRVCFTVVPGFKIGKTVIQSLVYLSPA